MSDRTLYYFAVGGTGALSVEPLLHLCAAGLGPARLSVTLIDADAGNPALARALELLLTYTQVRELFGKPTDGFFRTEIISTKGGGTWTPLGTGNGAVSGEVSLESFVQKALMVDSCEDARHLLDLLFSDSEQKERLKEGFRGHPAIGSVLMHGLKDAVVFKEMMASAKNDAESCFFAVGSVFGGTGAAALPVLAEILAQIGIARDRVGAALVTPYYSLGQPSQAEEQDHRLKPDSARFLYAATGALPTYVHGDSQYGRLYAVGDDQSLAQARKIYSAGGKDQRNDPHFVELYAAAAALDFMSSRESAGLSPIRYVTVGDPDPTWTDLPLAGVNDLVALFIASNFFLQYFGAHRSPADEQRLTNELQKVGGWLHDIALKPTFVREHARELNTLGKYFESVWGYLWAITNNYRALRLVNFDIPTSTRVSVPATYASGGDGSSEFSLPQVDRCFEGYNARRRGGWLKRAEPDHLGSLAEMFNWYNLVNVAGDTGMRGLLRYLRLGSHKFFADWYSPAGVSQRVQV